MFELLWKVGVLSAVLVFGVKIGLAMGFAGLSRKVAVAIAIGYGLGILILTKIAENYSETLYHVIYDYNFVIFLAMAAVIFYAGLHTINDWKKHKKDHAKASCMAMIAPCPCCFGAVVAAIILVSPLIGATSFAVGQYAAISLTLVIAIFYALSDVIVRVIKKPYPVLLGNFMLFVGLYFLASAIVLPNIGTVLQSPMSPLNLPSTNEIIYVIVLVVLLVVFGVYLNRRNSVLVEKKIER